MKANRGFILSWYATILLVLFYVLSAKAQFVIFNFDGTLNVKSDTNNLLPISITSTSAFTGTIAYDAGLGPDVAPADLTYGYFIYGTGKGLNMSATIAGNTFSGTNSPYDVFIIHDQVPGVFYDELSWEVNRIQFNGAMPPGSDAGNLDVDLIDSSCTALNTDARPLSAPVLAKFPNLHRLDIYASSNGVKAFSLSGTITNITQVVPPLLSIVPTNSSQVLISWTQMATNYVLERALSVTGSWSPVSPPFQTNGGTISVVTTPPSTNTFYRLHTTYP